MRGAGRRRGGRDSAAPDRRPPPPTPTAPNPNDAWQYTSAGGGRDSDASFASSRPSSSSIGLNPRSSGVPISDRNYQHSAIRAINAFLASHSLPFSLKPPFPSAKDITETIKFILSQFGVSKFQKVEDDFQHLLKSLNCPVKVNKSALRAPGTPHSWPSLLGAIHWLVQLLMYDDHQLNSTQMQLTFMENRMFRYVLESYSHFITGKDDEVDRVDSTFMQEMMQEKERVAEEMMALESNAKELEGTLERLKTGPSEREVLEKEKSMLELDVKKFRDMIEQLEGRKVAMSKLLEEKEKGVEIKNTEKESILVENEELKKRVEEQGINARDAERMKRELQALEGNIAEIEAARNKWEEKVWELDSMIGQKYEKLEELMIECNQAIRRLKLGNEFHYQLNAKGSSTREVLGIDYKSILKPALASLEEEMKKSSMEKLEGLISLQQQSIDKTTKIEAKRNRLTTLQAHIDEVEGQLDLMRRETLDFASRCATEAKKMAEDIAAEAQNMDLVEREAAEFLKASNAKLQEIIMQTEEEIQLCARELFAVVDSVSKYKEYMASRTAIMKNDLIETSCSIANIHKGCLPAPFGVVSGVLDASVASNNK
nr:kinetochore protein NDC80 homolog [Ipomoea batatas]